MDEERLTRQELVKRGVTASVVVAVGLDAASAAGAPAGEAAEGVLAGVVTRVTGPESALVKVTGKGSTRVRLAPGAFVSHGIDRRTRDLRAFLPGERVAVRGSVANGTMSAVEFQSIYTQEAGVVRVDRSGRTTLRTPNGAVRVPHDVTIRPGANGFERIRNGVTGSATVWTNPSTGERTALLLTLAA